MKCILLAVMIIVGMLGQSANAAIISLSDDNSSSQSIGFDFEFFGNTYDAVFVGLNGYLTFGSSDTEWVETVSTFLNNEARIAVWDDFTPSDGRTIEVTHTASQFRARYDSIPEFGSNSFDITIFSNGTIEIFLESLTTTDLIEGLSAGGVTTAATEADFSTSTSGEFSNRYSLYQRFDGSFDLNGRTLTFVSAPGMLLMFGLGISCCSPSQDFLKNFNTKARVGLN